MMIGRILRLSAIGVLALASAVPLPARAAQVPGVQHLPNGDVRVEGPGAPPQLVFACDSNTGALQSLLAGGTLIAQLQNLHAGIALTTKGLSFSRAEIVRRLNEAQIPVIAWLTLPAQDGYYLNASNEPEAAARFAAFERWTATYNLHWSGVGLDIEPSLNLFAALRNHPFRLIPALLWRSMDWVRVRRARRSYTELIHRIESTGYPVQTYQFPFLADERQVHSTLLERVFGIVDVSPASAALAPPGAGESARPPLRESSEALMIYTSFNQQAGAALILGYGPEAQAIAIGSTASSGDPMLDRKFPPLDWNEFSRDLIVASHFSRLVGVYNLAGCVHQGFLSRLNGFDWSQSVTISSASIRRVKHLRHVIETVLWLLSHLPYFAAALFLAAALLIWRRHSRKRRERSGTAPVSQRPPAAPRWHSR